MAKDAFVDFSVLFRMEFEMFSEVAFLGKRSPAIFADERFRRSMKSLMLVKAVECVENLVTKGERAFIYFPFLLIVNGRPGIRRRSDALRTSDMSGALVLV